LQRHAIFCCGFVPFSLLEKVVALAGEMFGAASFHPMVAGFCAKDCRYQQDRHRHPDKGTAFS
jgi:hypothetical protein